MFYNASQERPIGCLHNTESCYGYGACNEESDPPFIPIDERETSGSLQRCLPSPVVELHAAFGFAEE